MSGMLPVALYGLKVPAGDVMVPATMDFPATFHITMAAIDPSVIPEHTGTANGEQPPRATLKLVYEPMAPEDNEDDSKKEQLLRKLLGAPSDEDDEDNSMKEDFLRKLLGAPSDEDNDEDEEDEDDESSDDEDEKNGGPSDPSKTKKARKQAAAMMLLAALQNGADESDEEMEDASLPKTNGVSSKSGKGKGKAVAGSEDSSDEEDDEDEEVKEIVLCTLDPGQHYQQTLDITIPEGQNAYFKVSGTHAVHLSGNYVIPPDDGHKHHEDEDPEEYDMSPDEDELGEDFDDDEESDELDDLEDPRITELKSDDEAPKLTKTEKPEPVQKGKNKRPADESDEEPVTLDAIMDKSLKPAEPAPATEPKLSKKQLKKLKNNAGKAVEAAVENKDVKKEDEANAAKSDKKVQFAKNLEQGPSGVTKEAKLTKEAKQDTKGDAKPGKQENEKPKASLGPKTLQDGVKIDDRKLGTGPAAKKGDKVGMRYIGKLEDGKVFDANKKGAPFKFTLGLGEVIKGWDIGIAGMSVGGERRVSIPAKAAYGSKSQPGIPANSPLQFDVKLLQIN